VAFVRLYLGIFSGRANLPLTHVKLPNWQEKNLSISHRGGAEGRGSLEIKTPR
jgi:hypothetical protein